MSFISYTVGLNNRHNEVQALNGLGWIAGSTACYFVWPGSKHIKKVEKEGGRRIELPRKLRIRAQLLTTVHGLGFLVPAATFLVALPLNRFVTPPWLSNFDLPAVTSPLLYHGLRLLGCVGSIGFGFASATALKHLGSQWNYLGVRERPKVVKTGPYSVVRHPMYSYAMLLEVCFAGMFWNWMPLAVLGCVTIPAFAIKIPMEERVILESKIGKDYKEYQKVVRWRVFPYFW